MSAAASAAATRVTSSARRRASDVAVAIARSAVVVGVTVATVVLRYRAVVVMVPTVVLGGIGRHRHRGCSGERADGREGRGRESLDRHLGPFGREGQQAHAALEPLGRPPARFLAKRRLRLRGPQVADPDSSPSRGHLVGRPQTTNPQRERKSGATALPYLVDPAETPYDLSASQ